MTWSGYEAAKTHCPQGHEYTPENTRVYGGGRYCKECGRERSRVRMREVRRLATAERRAAKEAV